MSDTVGEVARVDADPNPLRSTLFTLLCIGYLMTTAFEFLLPPVMPVISEDLGISFGQQGALFLTVSISEAVANFVTGWWRDRVAGRTLSVLALTIAASGCTLTAAWPRYDVLLVAQGLIGAGAGAFFAVAAPKVSQLAGVGRRGRAFGIWGAAVSVGGLGAAVLAATMAEQSWRTTYVALALGGVVLILAFARQPADPPVGLTRDEGTLKIVVSSTFARLTALGMVATSAQVGVSAFLPAYAVDNLHFSVGTAAALLAGGRIVSLPAKIASGAAGDRFGRPRMLLFVMIGAVACMAAFLSGQRLLAAVGIIAYVAVAGALFPLVNALLGDWLPHGNLGSGYGTFRALQIGFGGLIALAIGVLSDIIGLRLSLCIGLVTLTGGMVLVRGQSETPHPITPLVTPPSGG